MARATDQDWLSPSLMHQDVGEVDFVSHVHVPAVMVQPYAPSDDPSYCAGHAAAVSSQSFSVTGTNDCIEGFPQRGGCYLLTWLDRNFWMKRSSAESGTDARHVDSREDP